MIDLCCSFCCTTPAHAPDKIKKNKGSFCVYEKTIYDTVYDKNIEKDIRIILNNNKQNVNKKKSDNEEKGKKEVGLEGGDESHKLSRGRNNKGVRTYSTYALGIQTKVDSPS